MSSRFNNNTSKGGYVKTHQKFVPQNRTSNQNPTPTLSNSLRESFSSKNSDAPSGSNTSISTRRVEMGDSASTRPKGGNFVNYLPQDEAVAAGLGAEDGGLDAMESQKVVDLLNRELSRLLMLKPREFWKEVASDISLHEFLDSFLQSRSRWYDFPLLKANKVVAGVIVGERDLCRRVFMVLYRISSNKDPGARSADSLSEKDHQALLQEKKLLDLSKLLDICAIYSHENEELTGMLVENAMKAQPWIHNDLSAVTSHFLGIVHTMHERCNSSLEALFASGIPDEHNSPQLQVDLQEVMDFINDAIVAMDTFLNAYKQAAPFFLCPVEMSHGNEELLSTLAKLHDSLLPSLQRSFCIIFAAKEDSAVSNTVLNLKALSMRLVNFGWRLLEYCYLNEELLNDDTPLLATAKMFPANVEEPLVRGDILVQTFREISSLSLQYQESQQRETFLKQIEKTYNILHRIQYLRDTGWIFVDEEQFQYLSGIMECSSKEKSTGLLPETKPTVNKTSQLDEDAAIMESKISQIRDLFPDYGKGFLAACLEVYDQNPEEVIQRILEGTLHEDLLQLDTSLERMPSPASASTTRKDNKGKGKLHDSTYLPSNYEGSINSMQRAEGPLSSSSSTTGKYVRKSKGDFPDPSILDIKDVEDSARTAALVSQHEYEDEYDDSFDDLGLNVADMGVEENEILSDKINTESGKSWGKETEKPAHNAANTKWGSKKKPQYYVKDGKNYSYKVSGAVAVANADEASLVTRAQKELIYGLGRGGNHPLGAIKKLTKFYEEEENVHVHVSETEGRGTLYNRGMERRDGRRTHRESNEQQEKQSDIFEGEARRNTINYRGRGRRGGGRTNHYRKDQAMKKHFSGLSGY